MTKQIDRLIDIMAQLRTPETGCPWDLEQDFKSIAPYTIEEAYEVADAIDRSDMADLKDELGDLLLQVVFHSRMAEEQNLFSFEDVASSISDKMIRRHPHVFGNNTASTPDQVKESWEDTKAKERAAKGQTESALDGVAVNLPSLTRSEKLTKRAARVRFDWTDAKDIFNKIEEEIGELKTEINANSPHERLEDELGDLLFCIANLARHLKIDPELALRKANNKFCNRFKLMEESFKAMNQELRDQTLDRMEQEWQSVKERLRNQESIS